MCVLKVGRGVFIDCKRKIYLLFNIFVINFDWLQLCLYGACGKLNYYSNAFALRLKHSYSYIIIQIAFFFTCVGIFIWSTLCLLSLLNSLLFLKSTERYSISNLSSLLHVMPSHFINIRVINDITCQSFFWKEYFVKNLICMELWCVKKVGKRVIHKFWGVKRYRAFSYYCAYTCVWAKIKLLLRIALGT